MSYPRDMIGSEGEPPQADWPGGAHDTVWVCRRADMAHHWRERHPYRGDRA